MHAARAVYDQRHARRQLFDSVHERSRSRNPSAAEVFGNRRRAEAEPPEEIVEREIERIRTGFARLEPVERAADPGRIGAALRQHPEVRALVGRLHTVESAARCARSPVHDAGTGPAPAPRCGGARGTAP